MENKRSKMLISKEILYVFLIFNVVLFAFFAVKHVQYTNSKPILECYEASVYPEKVPCSFKQFTMQISKGYLLFTVLPLELVAVTGLALTVILRKILDRKIKNLSRKKSLILTTTIFFIIWLGVVASWIYSMVHKSL